MSKQANWKKLRTFNPPKVSLFTLKLHVWSDQQLNWNWEEFRFFCSQEILAPDELSRKISEDLFMEEEERNEKNPQKSLVKALLD